MKVCVHNHVVYLGMREFFLDKGVFFSCKQSCTRAYLVYVSPRIHESAEWVLCWFCPVLPSCTYTDSSGRGLVGPKVLAHMLAAGASFWLGCTSFLTGDTREALLIFSTISVVWSHFYKLVVNRTKEDIKGYLLLYSCLKIILWKLISYIQQGYVSQI